MKRVDMVKYGFVRTPESDFSDDGTRFYTYRVGERVQVTKATYKGEAYIDGTIHGTKLPYEVYSKLPHYAAIGKLNGVSISSLTDQDLIDLYEACVAYEQEYTEAENNIQMPPLDEIKAQCLKVQAKRMTEFAEIEKLMSENAMKLALKLSKWQWATLRDYLENLVAKLANYNPELYASTILNSARSINFCKPDCTELKDSWYYTQLIELINSVQV
jgi:hypothetical protein